MTLSATPTPVPTQTRRRLRLRLRQHLLWLAAPAAVLLVAVVHAQLPAWRGTDAAAAAAKAPPRTPVAKPAAAAAAASATAPAPASPSAITSALQLERLFTRGDPAPHGALVDLFAVPAPARPNTTAPVEPPPPPRAPRFPYSYVGSLLDDGARTGFFSQGERVLALRSGDVVDGSYRVDEVGATALTVTYLPLNERLVLAYGAPT